MKSKCLFTYPLRLYDIRAVLNQYYGGQFFMQHINEWLWITFVLLSVLKIITNRMVNRQR